MILKHIIFIPKIHKPKVFYYKFPQKSRTKNFLMIFQTFGAQRSHDILPHLILYLIALFKGNLPQSM